MKSRRPVKRSRKCPRGIRKTDGKCKRKPGPKRSRKMKRSRRRTSKKLAKTVRRSRKCVRGKRKSDGKCKRKPGPKRSRKRKSYRNKFHMGPSDSFYQTAVQTLGNYLEYSKTDAKLWDDSIIENYNKGEIKCGNYSSSSSSIDMCKNLIEAITIIYEKGGKKIGGGTYASLWMTHYDKEPYNNILLRTQTINNLSKKFIQDEIKLTLQMSETGCGPKVYGIFCDQNHTYTLVQKYDSDGSIFIKEYPDKLVNYIECLFQRYQCLIDLGWLCYDLKPQNTLVYTDDKANCESVVLTDFGADFCRQHVDNVIENLEMNGIATSKENAKRQLATLLTTITIFHVICMYDSGKRDEILQKMKIAYKKLNITKYDFKTLLLFIHEKYIELLDPKPEKSPGISLYTTLSHYLRSCDILLPISIYYEKMKIDLEKPDCKTKDLTWLSKKARPYTCREILQYFKKVEKEKALKLQTITDFSNDFTLPEVIQFVFVYLLDKVGIDGISEIIQNKTLKKLQETIKQPPVMSLSPPQPDTDFKTAGEQFNDSI